MFRIAEIFVDDKKLASFLRACAGMIDRMDPPQPVINAEVKDGVITQVTDGKIEDLFYNHICEQNPEVFTARDIQGFLVTIGKSPGSSAYVAKQLKKRGLIKTVGPKQAGKYTVSKR